MTFAAGPASPSIANAITTRATLPAARHHRPFHELLSELNPLQYIPVVGTIYRTVTGDTIPDAARTVGSLVVSGLTGGPIGVATSLAAVAVEKATGFDPERFGRRLLSFLGIGEQRGPNAIPAAHLTAAAPPAPVSAPPQASAWSDVQLAHLGVTTAGGTIRLGEIAGCDVLNNLELARLDAAPTLPAASFAGEFRPLVA